MIQIGSSIKVLRFFCSIFLISAFGVQNLSAAEDDYGDMSLEQLMELTITSTTKTEKSITESPGSVTLITRSEIESSTARTLPELLRNVAGVNVRWNPMAETIDIRGFGENPLTNRVLLLIDGIPFNSQSEGGFPQHMGFDFFNLANVKQVEVIRGGGSSLYGENAYWGIINIVSLSGSDIEGTRLTLYGGDRDTREIGVTIGNSFDTDGILGKGDWILSSQFLDTQLPNKFWYEENDAAYEGKNVFFKLNAGGANFSYYRHEAKNEDYQLALGVKIANSVFASAETIEETIDIVSAGYEKDLTDELKVTSDLSYMQRQGSQCSACHAAQQYPDSSDTDGKHGNQTTLDVRAQLSSFDHHKILLGVEARWVDAGRDRTELLNRDPNAVSNVLKYNKRAIYLQDEMSFLEDKLNIIAGYRLDLATDPDLFESNTSPRVSVVYSAKDNLTLKAGYSKSFHFPDFSTMYLATWFLNEATPVEVTPAQAVGSVDFVANPDLNPEEISNFDLGAVMLLNKSFSASLNLFQSTVDDFIVMTFVNLNDPAIDQLRFENHPGEATIIGGELEFKYKNTTGLHGYLSFSYQNNTRDDDLLDSTGVPIEFSYSPEWKVNAGIGFDDFHGWSTMLELNWKDEYVAPQIWYFEEPVTPINAYALGHIRIAYKFPKLFGDDSLRFSVIGRNLLDKEQEETKLGLNNRIAGREFFVGLEYRRDFSN